MANSKSWLNNVYLVYFIIHVPVMLFVDLVPMYPRELWEPAGSPLHFLQHLRTFHYETNGDQFFAPSPAVPPRFFIASTFLELTFHFPVTLWAIATLWPRRGISGAAELMFLVYGLETVLTTAFCLYEGIYWDNALVSVEQKQALLGGMYGPYLAIAIVMSVDMYSRLLARFNTVDEAKKLQ